MIAYSGNGSFTTFTQSAGTRREIVDNLVSILSATGWTVVSGGGTGDVLLQSATTPQSLSIRCRIYDPGSGNCARLQMRNTTGSKVSSGCVLLPAVSKVWRVHACKYQFFIFTPGDSAAREFFAMGVPWIPSFLVGIITGDCGWANGNAISDTDTTARACWRNSLASNTNACWSGLVNDNLIDRFFSGGSGASCDLRLCIQLGSWTTIYDHYQWHDASEFLSDPLVAWGCPNTSDVAKIRGQMWDAVVVSGAYAADSAFSFDSHTWYGVSNNVLGGTYSARGCLLLMAT